MNSIFFRLEGTPVPKERYRYRIVKRLGKTFAKTYTPAKTMAYETKVAAMFLKHAKDLSEETKKDSVIALNLYFSFGDKRRRDIDNCIKSILDALNKVAWVDDSQVVALAAYKTIGQKEEFAMVQVVYYNAGEQNIHASYKPKTKEEEDENN